MSPTRSRDPQRIAKLLARAGIASRREIERMIADGRVALNGVALDTPATLLASLHGVTVDGEPVQQAAPARLFRYHKPSGLLTTERDPAGRPTIYDRLPPGLPRVMPVGRLDLNTEGLLLLTTDGELKRELELPSVGVERSYRARAYGQVSQAQLEDLMLGVEIEGVRYGPINANIERRTGANLWIEMTLTEGKNREIRRVLEHLGVQVSRLIRTRYGPFHLGDMPAGDVDEIRQADLVTFRTVLAKPGGGKAASNLQFAVRARAEAPRAHTEAPGETVTRAPRLDRRPARSPRPTPVLGAEITDRRPRPGARGERGPARGSAAESPKRPARPHSRPGRDPEATERRQRPDAGRAARPERPQREARFTPRVTPERGEPKLSADPREIGKPGRAARAKAHRETLAPREGDLVDRPRTARPPRPAAGPAGGRGAPRPGKPGGRPPRTRK